MQGDHAKHQRLNASAVAQLRSEVRPTAEHDIHPVSVRSR